MVLSFCVNGHQRIDDVEEWEADRFFAYFDALVELSRSEEG
ncbi:hypothetical protein [Jiella endophytica]|nr:hypothetical protein [Jiella endophytica]